MARRTDKPRAGALDAEALRLWAQVTATVTPLAARGRPSVPRRRLPAAPPPASPAPIGGSASDTLDASWDRRLASGKLRPDLVLDLHGLSRERARQLLRARVADASARGLRTVLVITGKGALAAPAPIDLMQERPSRGVIRAALPRWLAEPDIAAYVAAVRRAHVRHGGSGAVYLVLRRRRR